MMNDLDGEELKNEFEKSQAFQRLSDEKKVAVLEMLRVIVALNDSALSAKYEADEMIRNADDMLESLRDQFAIGGGPNIDDLDSLDKFLDLCHIVPWDSVGGDNVEVTFRKAIAGLWKAFPPQTGD